MTQQQIGHYLVENQIGEGSFAYVYRAKDIDLGRDVALKILKPAWLSDPVAIERFIQEARTMANLHHPHIAVIYDVGQTEGQVYLAEFLVDGESLAQRIARQGPLAWEETLNILRPIASALDYAHAQGVVHRDIKPTNILLDKEGQAYLCDFGLVRAAVESVSLSGSLGGVKGTAAYIPPEVWDEQQATPASDVYALSCVVSEMLSGEVLFEGSSMMAVMRKHDRGPHFPDAWPAGIPAGVTRVLQHGLAKDPAQRIRSAGQLVTELEALTASAPAIDTAPSSKRSVAGWIGLLIGGGAVLIVAVCAIIFLINQIGNGGPTPTPKAAESPPVVAGSDNTPTNTPTPSPTPTDTPPSPTDTPPPTLTPTDTPLPPTQTSTPTRRPTNTPRPATNTPTPLPTSTPTATLTPTAPPPGPGLIAFSSDRDGNPEIYAISSDGSTVTRLTNHPDSDNEPAWSPDGTKLAFISDRDGDPEIYVMDADGSNIVQLTDNTFRDLSPAWSPDGTQLAFQSDRDTPLSVFEIYVMQSDGSDQRRLTNNSIYDGCPSWSPDGTRISYLVNNDGVANIYLMNPDGSAQTQLTNSGEEGCAEWSPDGTQLAFYSRQDGNSEIYILNLNDLSQRRLTNNAAFEFGPTWSPDGTQLAFTSDRTGNPEIFLTNLDGSQQTNLTNSPTGDSNPTWQP